MTGPAMEIHNSSVGRSIRSILDKSADGEHHDLGGADSESRRYQRMRHLMQQHAGEQPQQKQRVVGAGLVAAEYGNHKEDEQDQKCEVQPYGYSQHAEAPHGSRGPAISQRSYSIHSSTITKH